MENETGKPLQNTTQELRRSLIRLELLTLLENIGQKNDPPRINYYAEALDDLTPIQIEHGFAVVKRQAGQFWPSILEIREACESWRPEAPAPEEPLTKADLVVAGKRNRVTHEEMMQWLEEGQRAQQEHIANLKVDPVWQKMKKNLTKNRR